MTTADRDLVGSAAPTGAAEPTRRELRRLEIAMLGAGLAGFGLLYCTQALLPAIGHTFDVGPTVAALTVALTTGALALAIVPMSSLAESFGRARVMRSALVAACLLTVAGAFAGAFWQELVARSLVGIALAGVVAVLAMAMAAALAPWCSWCCCPSPAGSRPCRSTSAPTCARSRATRANRVSGSSASPRCC